VQPANDNRVDGYNGAFDKRLIQPAAFQGDDDTLRQLLRRLATFTSLNRPGIFGGSNS
jgi:hypothetical protein